MSKFELEWIAIPDYVEPFFKLFINGRCPLDIFWEEMEKLEICKRT